MVFCYGSWNWLGKQMFTEHRLCVIELLKIQCRKKWLKAKERKQTCLINYFILGIKGSKELCANYTSFLFISLLHWLPFSPNFTVLTHLFSFPLDCFVFQNFCMALEHRTQDQLGLVSALTAYYTKRKINSSVYCLHVTQATILRPESNNNNDKTLFKLTLNLSVQRNFIITFPVQCYCFSSSNFQIHMK